MQTQASLFLCQDARTVLEDWAFLLDFIIRNHFNFPHFEENVCERFFKFKLAKLRELFFPVSRGESNSMRSQSMGK